jgi:HEAT repeat protein
MSAGTLKGMMKAEDAEMRRGAVLAAAMKDDKAHVPDLIDRLTDEEEVVVRAARAGLKSLTSQDFGPKNGATKAECKAAAAAWRAWWAKHPSK